MTTPRPADAAARPGRVRSAKTRLCGVVVICAGCAERQGLRPRALRRLVKDAAKRAARELPPDGRGRRRKLCVAEAGCLGPCPKRAVAVATGPGLAAGRALLLDPAAGPEAVVAVVRAALAPPNSAPLPA